jgi:enamine deaminase RidA (YjgF/YER057c/UK114 family)
MKTQVHAPTDAPRPASNYAQGLSVDAASRWLTVSGQVGLTPVGSLLAGTEAQMRQAFHNILAVVADARMQPSNLVKLSVFLVDATDVPLYRQIRDEMLPGLTIASTLLVVDALAHPDWKVEIEAIAAA